MLPNEPHYLNAREWAKLVAYIWLQPAFAEDFETDPVRAIYDDKELRTALGFRFAPEASGDDEATMPMPLTRIIRLPVDPGYGMDELYGAITGEVTIVPMTSWIVHGT